MMNSELKWNPTGSFVFLILVFLAKTDHSRRVEQSLGSEITKHSLSSLLGTPDVQKSLSHVQEFLIKHCVDEKRSEENDQSWVKSPLCAAVLSRKASRSISTLQADDQEQQERTSASAPVTNTHKSESIVSRHHLYLIFICSGSVTLV